MKKYSALLCLLFLSPGRLLASESVNWETLIGEDPLTQKSACLLRSASLQSKDGQSTTPVSITYNGEVFIVTTESNIDLSYDNLGLQIDYKDHHPIDSIYKKTNVIFEENTTQIRDELIKGLYGKLTLGFWPTWPKTTAYTIEFNLVGFTKAYHQFVNCQETGQTS